MDAKERSQHSHPAAPNRWFQVSNVKGIVSSLNQEIAGIDEKRGLRRAAKDVSKPSDAKKMSLIAIGMAMVLVLIPLGMLSLSNNVDPDHEVSSGTIILLVVFLTALLGAAVFGSGRLFGVREHRMKQRHFALHRLAKRSDLALLCRGAL